MGDVDVFKRIEESVFNTLANDICPRYTMDQRKGSTDVINNFLKLTRQLNVTEKQ
jgi:hypothetical protein